MGMEQGGYTTDSGGGDQGSYDYGGSVSDVFVLDPGFMLDFGESLPPDYEPGLEPSSGEYYYDPSTGNVLDTGLQQGSDTSQSDSFDLFQTFLDDYIALGYDALTAADFAAQEVAATTTIPTIEQGPLPEATLPTIPLQSFYDYWQSPPYVPDFSYYYELPVPPPPEQPSPPSPATTQTTHLPPACKTGTYHPYPIGHPQQDICVPFPTATTPTPQQQPKSTGGGATATSKPPAQQQPKCPTGYYLDPLTKQCKPIPQGQPQQCPTGYYRASNGQCLPIPKCTTPGTVFDQARGLCVPAGQAISPLPSEFGDVFGDLKNIPWWVWAALAGLLLLGGGSEERKKVTVQHRRAT